MMFCHVVPAEETFLRVVTLPATAALVPEMVEMNYRSLAPHGDDVLLHHQRGDRLWIWFVSPSAAAGRGVAIPEPYLYWQHVAPATGDALLYGQRNGATLYMAFNQGMLVGQLSRPREDSQDEQKRVLGLLAKQHSLHSPEIFSLDGAPSPRPRLRDVNAFVHWSPDRGSLLVWGGRAVQLPLIVVLAVLGLSQLLMHTRLEERVEDERASLERLREDTSQLLQIVLRAEEQATFWRFIRQEEFSGPAFGHILLELCNSIQKLDGRLSAVEYAPGRLRVWCILSRERAGEIVDAFLEHSFLKSVRVENNRPHRDRTEDEEDLRLLELTLLMADQAASETPEPTTPQGDR
jgi:hypothetical protein